MTRPTRGGYRDQFGVLRLKPKPRAQKTFVSEAKVPKTSAKSRLAPAQGSKGKP